MIEVRRNSANANPIDAAKTGLFVDVTGKVHGKLPKIIDFKDSSKEAIQDSIDALNRSIKTRMEEMKKKGFDTPSAANHMRRLMEERNLLRRLENKLNSGTGKKEK
jgi:biotin operon repressor